jgi:hypothetical protein
MDWLISLMNKNGTKGLTGEDKLHPAERLALELFTTGVQQLNSGQAGASIVTFSKSLSYGGRAETYLFRAKAYVAKAFVFIDSTVDYRADAEYENY